MEQMKNVYKFPVFRNAEEKIPLARPRLRWEDNIKMNLKYARKLWNSSRRIHTRAVINKVMDLRAP
jgi:hypothetical protein